MRRSADRITSLRELYGFSPVPSPQLPSPLIELNDERFSSRGLRLSLKREDLIHPTIPGNKWRKLVPNLTAAKHQGFTRLLTFGGAWSNHIRATAAAGELYEIETVGVIRGEEHLPLNPTLAEAVDRGMRLVYLDRATYRRKHTPEVIERLREEHGDVYLVPEGGSNELAVHSCREIPAEIEVDFDAVCCPVGTGGTLAGVAAGLRDGQRALGFSVLKGGQFLTGEVENLQTITFGAPSGNWAIECDYHFGGYAKRTPDLDRFIEDFAARHKVTLEWIYVAKMLYGVVDLATLGVFPPGTHVVALVTG
jgi:1-aminocyclopropane-1-carboxylate deaminase